MKKVLLALIVIWFLGAGYWYICKIKGACGETNSTRIDILSRSEFSSPYEIFFEPNSAKYLNTESVNDYLEKLADHLSTSDARVTLTGYTADLGHSAAYENMAKIRATEIQKKLVSFGADASRIMIDPKGKADPKAENVTEEGRAKNRRVEVVVKE